MKVIFRSLEDGSLVSLGHVSLFSVLPDKYEIVYQVGFAPLVEFIIFAFILCFVLLMNKGL